MLEYYVQAIYQALYVRVPLSSPQIHKALANFDSSNHR